MTGTSDGGPPEAGRRDRIGRGLYEGLGHVGGIILAAMAINNVIEGLRTSFPSLAG